MKIYVFDSINGVVIRKAAKSIDEAIAWFKATYPTRTFSCVYEQKNKLKSIDKLFKKSYNDYRK